MATHDLTQRYWGHDYIFTPIENGRKGKMTVWNPNPIYEGDYLLLRNGERSTRYQVDAVKIMTDPPDMMFLDVTFAPRQKRE
jgi:hypothetical protein